MLVQTRLGMRYAVNMRMLAARGCVAGILVALALPAHAQSETPALAEKSATEPSVQIDLAEKSETPAQTSSTIEAFVAKLDSATRAIHANAKNDPALMREGCRDLLSEILDINAMAQASNSEIWEQMTQLQRDTLRLAFEHRMVRNCVLQLGGYDGGYLKLVGVRTTDDGDRLATTRVGSQDDGKMVTWRLRSSRLGNWRAVDVITEGRSAVLDAHTEFTAALLSVNGDIEALITFMQK